MIEIKKIDSKKLFRCMKDSRILGAKMPFPSSADIDVDDVLRWFTDGEPSTDNLDMKLRALGDFLVNHVFGEKLKKIANNCENYGFSGTS